MNAHTQLGFANIDRSAGGARIAATGPGRPARDGADTDQLQVILDRPRAVRHSGRGRAWRKEIGDAT